jgi:hypothetical protein
LAFGFPGALIDGSAFFISKTNAALGASQARQKGRQQNVRAPSVSLQGARYLHYSCTGRKIVLEALMPKEAI